MSALSEKYKDRGLIVLGINVPWDKEQLVRVFMDVHRVTYLVGRDASGTISNLYDVEATPTSLFIDKAGRLVEQHVGALSEAEFQRRVEALLK
ncbi:MAG: TlpA family protein disulfide reductase [Zetaproteobacteria bacterium]|nr:MAG: TlpA family protein disulfide reductase [Zetaproteobacteria bacterium]